MAAIAGGGSATPAAGNFTNWLNNKLRELNTDESVFGSYITGILEGDETTEEKQDALEGILGEIIENNIQELIEEILIKWNDCHPKEDDSTKLKVTVDVDVQLAKMLESQKLQTTVQRQYTADELRVREQILAQYSQTEVSDEEDDEEGEEKPSSGGSALVKNTNAHDVMQLQKERREQARIDSQKKKDKDKEDREKQKQLKEEKKEKRKTVKGERRR